MTFPPPFGEGSPPTPEEREAIWTVNLIIIAFLLADYWFLVK